MNSVSRAIKLLIGKQQRKFQGDYTALAVSTQKKRLKENECAKHMLQITSGGKGLAPLESQAFRERNADEPGREERGVWGGWKVKIGRNLLVLSYFSMRSRVPIGQRAAAAATGHPAGLPKYSRGH